LELLALFPAPSPRCASEALRVNLADEAAVTSAVLNVFPEAIVNCAAVSSPKPATPTLFCPGPECRPAGHARPPQSRQSRLIHLSSEQVFAGEVDRTYGIGDATGADQSLRPTEGGK
jgi:dTDP-4-dehydrorhamnose reductase